MNRTVNFNQYSLGNHYVPGIMLGIKNVEMQVSEAYLLNKPT